MKKVAIIGLGLIGGSIAMALKNSGYYVIGIPHRKETLKKAEKAKAIDYGSLNLRAASDADFIFICTPINLILPKLKEILPVLKQGAIITDVGSTKQVIVESVEKFMPGDIFFVGGHPMAGKEKVKFEESEPGLFRDKVWILTQTKKTNKSAVFALEELVKIMGAKPVKMDPKVHDTVVAGISHMPLAVAAALVNAVAETKERDYMAKVASTGFRDTTRIASGDPVLGVDMFFTNKKAVLAMIEAFKKSLAKIEKVIKSGNSRAIASELEKAKSFRDSIYR